MSNMLAAQMMPASIVHIYLCLLFFARSCNCIVIAHDANKVTVVGEYMNLGGGKSKLLKAAISN